MSVTVTRTSADPKLEFAVEVRDARGASRHTVTLDPRLFTKLTAGRTVGAERFIEAVFTFLLERESKESIMSRFDVSVVSRYFPEFESEIGGYLG
jgi:hypothetical protein